MAQVVVFRNPLDGSRWRASGNNIALLTSWGWVPVADPNPEFYDPFPGYITSSELSGEMATEIADPASPASVALRAALAAVVTPEMLGAAHTYDAEVDDTPFVTAALLRAAEIGAEFRFRRMYNCPDGGLVAEGVPKLTGIGGRLRTAQMVTFPAVAVSGIQTATTTANGLRVVTPGTICEDFAILNAPSGTPTAGAGLKLESAHNFAVSRLTTSGFYDTAQIEGCFGTIDSSHFYDAYRYGMYFLADDPGLDDFGDQGVNNCVIAIRGRSGPPGESAVRWESGGGIRWTGNKIVGDSGPGQSGIPKWNYCVDLMAADGTDTVEFMIAGGGISSANNAIIRLGQKGPLNTGLFADLIVSGVVLQGAGGGCVAAIIGGADFPNRNKVRRVSFEGCTFKGVPAGGITIGNTRGINIGTNTWDNAAYTGPLITLGLINGDGGSGTSSVNIARQNLNANTSGVDVVYDRRNPTSNPHGNSGLIDHGWDSTMFADVVGTWITAGYVDLVEANGGAAELEFALTGYDHTFGPVFARYRRILTKTTGATTVAVTTDGTDVTAGAGNHYEVQFVTTTAKRVIVQYRLTTGGVTIWGRQRCKARGEIERLHIGP